LGKSGVKVEVGVVEFEYRSHCGFIVLGVDVVVESALEFLSRVDGRVVDECGGGWGWKGGTGNVQHKKRGSLLLCDGRDHGNENFVDV
jgi:hypothetical protein